MKVKQYKFWREDGTYFFEWQKAENKSCIVKLDMIQQAIFFEDLLKEAGYTKERKVKMRKRECLWEGEKDQPGVDFDRDLQLCRPCDCGTCRPGNAGVGYITGADEGKGVTIWIKSEKAYRRMRKLFKVNGLQFEK